MGGRRNDSDEERSESESPIKDKQHRKYRKTTGEDQTDKTKKAAAKTNIHVESQMAARIAAKVKQRVEQALNSPEIQKMIEEKLKTERALLEEKVTAQLEREKTALLAKKRQQQLDNKLKKEELDRIFRENQRKVEEANQQAAEERRRRESSGTGAYQSARPKQRPPGIRVVES